jgi:hypothetical protein
MAETLRSGQPSEIRKVFAILPDAQDLVGWDRIATQLLIIQTEVAGGAHRFEDVARICRSGDLLYDDSSRWDVLASFQQRYEALLASIGFADADLSRIAALDGGLLHSADDVYLVGLPDLPRITGLILRRATSSLTSLVHAPPKEAAQFDEIGCILPASWTNRPIPIGREQLRIVDRPADQAAELIREAGLLDGDGLADLVVAIPDDRILPYLQEWFESAGIQTHYAGGTPLVRSAPYRLLEAAAAYLDHPGWEEFAALIRHPDLEVAIRRRGDEGSRPPSLARLERYFHEHLPSVVEGSQAAPPPGEIRETDEINVIGRVK